MADAQTQTLPEIVRAKYPGVYDSVSDADLDAKVRERFPGVYDSIPGPKAASQPSSSMNAATKQLVHGTAMAATPVAAAARAVAQPLEEFATRPGATEALAGRLGLAGKIASTGTGLALAGKDLYEGRPVTAVVHAAEGITPTVVPMAYKALARYAGEELPDVASWLTKAIGFGARAAKAVANSATMLGAFGAEGEANARLNAPETILELAKSGTPEERVRVASVLRRQQPELADQILKLNTPDHADDIAMMKSAVDQGVTPSQAAAMVAKGDMQKYSRIITDFMKNRQVRP